jgi:hypothetical protein
MVDMIDFPRFTKDAKEDASIQRRCLRVPFQARPGVGRPILHRPEAAP